MFFKLYFDEVLIFISKIKMKIKLFDFAFQTETRDKILSIQRFHNLLKKN